MSSKFFLTQQMSIFFENKVDDGSPSVYIDDILLMSNSKEHMVHLIRTLHEVSKKEIIKLAS